MQKRHESASSLLPVARLHRFVTHLYAVVGSLKCIQRDSVGGTGYQTGDGGGAFVLVHCNLLLVAGGDVFGDYEPVC